MIPRLPWRSQQAPAPSVPAGFVPTIDAVDEEQHQQEQTPRMPIGAYIGVTIGVFGWLIGFAIVCIITGRMDALLAFLLPASAVNLGLAALYILVTDHALRRYGRGSMFQLVHWGCPHR